MPKIYTFLFSILLICSAEGQDRPGFFYDYAPDFNYTIGLRSFEFPGSQISVLDRLTNSFPGGFVQAGDISCITVLDSALNRIDTTIYFLHDTSSKYIHSITHQAVVNDTAYLLFECVAKPAQGSTIDYPINMLLVKMDTALNIVGSKYLFEQDSLGVLFSSRTGSFKYNKDKGLFDLFLMQYDTINDHTDVLLTRFDRQGEIRYFKKWDYTVWTPNQASFTDFEELGGGRYLLAQDVQNDMYVIADTAETEIDTSYFKPWLIMGLEAIAEKDDSYILFGTGDSKAYDHSDNHLRYIFLELDKQTLQEKSLQAYKMPDTMEYDIRALIWDNPFLILDDGDYLVTSYESYNEKSTGYLLSFCSIYRFDSTANLIWKFSIADTTHGELFGLSSMSKLSGTDEMILWHNTGYAPPGGGPRQTWVMKFDADGGNFDFSMKEEGKQPDFSIYPNPVSKLCVVLLPFVPTEEVSVEIYNMAGSLVQQKSFDQMDNRLELKTTLPEGNYLIKVKTDAYEAAQKMLVKN